MCLGVVCPGGASMRACYGVGVVSLEVLRLLVIRSVCDFFVAFYKWVGCGCCWRGAGVSAPLYVEPLWIYGRYYGVNAGVLFTGYRWVCRGD